MTGEREELRDWHRLFGLLLIDFFSDSPFHVEVEQDLSVQQQWLDVVIVRRRRGKFTGKLPDGLEELRPHNLVSFKSHHEALNARAMKELVGADVAYRKLVSPRPSEPLPDDQFGLYAVAARFPHNLSGQVPWQQRQAGVYDCQWGTDTIRVVVASELPREPHNAPLHLFSAAPNLVTFGSSTYQRRSENTSALLRQLFEALQGEGFSMTYTMKDFQRDYAKKHFHQLTSKEQREALELLSPEQRREILQALPPEDQREALKSLSPEHRREILQGLSVEELLRSLSEEQARQLLEKLATGRPTPAPKRRRKKG